MNQIETKTNSESELAKSEPQIQVIPEGYLLEKVGGAFTVAVNW